MQSGLQNATRYVLLCVTRFELVSSKCKDSIRTVQTQCIITS